MLVVFPDSGEQVGVESAQGQWGGHPDGRACLHISLTAYARSP